MICKACQERGKTWSGDDPECAFEHGEFDPEHNWACATMMRLRDIAQRVMFTVQHFESSHIATINLDTDDYGGWIVLTWYKDRGRTNIATFFDDMNDKIIPLTLDIANACLEQYKYALKHLDD